MATKSKSLPKPSEEFLEAICDSGSIVIDCDFCGRTHFGNEEPGMDWEEGEFERLFKPSKDNPDRYIYHSDRDTVHWGTLDGKQYVLDCPCNSASKYEDLFWRHRRTIADYFQARAKRELHDSKSNLELADSVSESITRTK